MLSVEQMQNMSKTLGAPPSGVLGGEQGQQDTGNSWNSYNAEFNQPQQIAQPTPQQPSQMQDIANIGSSLENRASNLTQDISDTATGKINPLETGVRATGEVAGGFNDVITGIVKALVPQSVQDTVGSAATDLAKSATETPLGQKLVPFFTKFAQDHPDATKDLGELGQILQAGTTVTGVGEGASAAEGIASTANDLADTAAEKVGINGSEKTTQTAIDAVTPDLKGKALVNHYLTDFGESAQKGGFIAQQTAGVTPEVTRVGTALQDVLTSKDPLTNLQNLGKEMNTTESKLGTLLEADKTPVVKQGVSQALDEAAEKIPREYQGIKENEKVFNNVFDFAKEQVNNSTSDVNGLRNARINFDTQTKMEFPSAFKNGYIDVSTPAGRAIKLARDTINDYAYQTAENGSELQQLIGHESDIFKAAQNIAPKVAKNEGTTLLNNIINTAKSHPVISATVAVATGIGIGKKLINP